MAKAGCPGITGDDPSRLHDYIEEERSVRQRFGWDPHEIPHPDLYATLDDSRRAIDAYWSVVSQHGIPLLLAEIETAERGRNEKR